VLQYKLLKQAIASAEKGGSSEGGSSAELFKTEFTQMLDAEVSRVNDFYMDRIEEGVIILHALRTHGEQIQAGAAPAEARGAVQQSLVSFHRNLLVLQNYVALNFTAIAKILKKFDKRIGAPLHADYIAAIVELPFYQCQSLATLVEDAEEQFRALERPAPDQTQRQQQAQQQQAQQQQAHVMVVS